MMRCDQPGCDGQIDADGYCDVCGHKPRAAGTAPTPAAAPEPLTGPVGSPMASTATGPATSGTGSASWSTGTARTGSSASRGNRGVGLVRVPPVPVVDPSTLVMKGNPPEVPEKSRFCPKCGRKVGRGRNGQPGLTEGFCPVCSTKERPTRYSFTPKLAPGDVVGDQYESVGCLAHGGMGWVYLARQHNVSGRWVVLKGLLDSGDESAMAAAIAERRFLAEVDHPNIVRIIDFVDDGDAGYIVMDYVGGRSLKDLRQSGLDGQGRPTPLPVDQAIELMLAVLPALGYLHARGMVFCDFKPDNVIQSGDQVKIIDLGGVRRLDDPTGDLYGTVGYQAPEVSEVGPSVTSDLYTVARALAVLTFDFRGYQDPARFATSLPDPSSVPVFQRYPSFHWFLLRATDPDPARRFGSAEEMAEQLAGVYRQVLAIDGDPDSPVPSQLFTPEVLVEPDRADWRNLPMPNVDPADPGATLLASLSGLATVPAEQLLVTLLAAPPSPEISYRIAHTYLDADRGADAAAALEGADPGDWRTAWWQGVQLLASGDSVGAMTSFGSLARHLPGELAPRLALAVAAEAAGDGNPEAASDAVAASHYDLVSAVDPGYSSASFGLARTLRRAGDRAGAAAALTRIPDSSIWSTAAQLQRCRILSGSSLGQPPTVWDLTEASAGLDRSTADAGLRAGVRRDLLEATLDLLEQGQAQPDPTIQIAGAPLQPQDLRVALEGTYRLLAKAAGSDAERVTLIDAANRSRPRTLV